MAIGSTIAGSALGGAMGNIATEQLLHKLMGGISGVLKSDFVKETAQNVMKQQVPKAFGIGVTEEAEFNTAKNLLSPADQYRIARILTSLSKKNKKHVQRWWLILATKTVEGVKWDPQGYAIVPSLNQSQDTDVWGLSKRRASHGKTKGPVDVAGTPADPRVIALQNVADMVRQPHGPNGDIKLFDREGNEKPTMAGDSAEAVEHAADHLRITILEDYHFYSSLLKWWEETEVLKTVLEKSKAAAEKTSEVLKTQANSILTSWLALEIGEDNLREILGSNRSVLAKQIAVERCLLKAIKAKKKKIAENAFGQGPLHLLRVGFTLVVAGTTLISIAQCAAS